MYLRNLISKRLKEINVEEINLQREIEGLKKDLKNKEIQLNDLISEATELRKSLK